MIARGGDSILLVIDVQNDFCPGGNLSVEQGDEVVEVINRIMPSFSRVIVTQDWHPRDHISFASTHPGRRPLDRIEVDGVPQMVWPDHCIQGTTGAELHPRLDIRKVALVLRKGMNPRIDSYSAFFENDKKTDTGLRHYLKGLGAREIVLCGLATDFCVFASAMDARGLGFRVILVNDACRGVDSPPGSVAEALSEMSRVGVRIVDSAELG
jgi:nicotinamidase/pyrazinamidase